MRSVRLFSSAAYRTAAIMCGVFFAAGLIIASIGPSLPVLATRLGVDVAALGGLFTAFSTGVLLAQVVVVRSNRRFGGRVTLAASILLMGAGSLAIAQGTGLPALFAGALLAGFGFGGVMATGNTLVAQLFPQGSAAALNGINLFFGVGSIIGPAIAAAANARLNAPQIALWIGAGALVALSPVVLGAVAHSVASTVSASGARDAAPVRSWLVGILMLIYTGTEIGFGAWLTLYMITSAALEVVSAALAVSGFWLAMTVGRALAVAIGRRLSAPNLLRLCLGGMLLGALLLAASIGNIALTLAGVLLFGLSCGPVFPTALALVASGANGGAATSKVLAMSNVGGMLIPALLGLLLAHYGPLAVTALLILAALAMIGLWMAAFRPQPAASMAGELYAPESSCP